MTMPIPENAEPTAAQPYYVRETQPWAIQQERQRHSQALYLVGEYAMFTLMWHEDDFLAGLVQKCTRCFGAPGTVKRKVAEAYNQPDKALCPVCFGTTFEGGFKAQIIRPAIFSDADEDEQRVSRGVANPQALDLESTTDFRVRSFDYVFRSTGDRYQLRVPNRETVRTGFAVPHQSSMAVGYNHARANQEALTSVAYIIPPTNDTLLALLNMASRAPIDFSEFETIRAALIPPNDD